MDMLSLLEEIQIIARNGLNYSENPYDLERYQHLLALATNTYSRLFTLPEEEIAQRFAAETGYITPKVGADAAIFDERGRILLMQRVDDQKWCLPCGWVNPNESPMEAAIREAREETGFEVEVVELVDVFSRKAGLDYGPHSMVAVVYLCQIIGGERRLSHEGVDLQYWPIEAVSDWHGIHQQYAQRAFEHWQHWQR
jgi:ADP-ribose pyrophosphatase YjhB (NUDIX family)